MMALPAAAAADAFPLTVVDDEGTEVTIEAQPQRIISLSPATTETGNGIVHPAFSGLVVLRAPPGEILHAPPEHAPRSGVHHALLRPSCNY